MLNKNIVGQRIKNAISMRGYTQLMLATALSERELFSSEDIINSYRTSVNRWVNGSVVPREDKLLAIAEILNISLEYLKGEINLPVPYYLSNEEQAKWDNIRKQGYLLKYINECLEYDIDLDFAKDEKGNQIESLFYQIEREVRAFLIARFEGLGIQSGKRREE